GQERINFTLNGVPLNDMIDHGVFFSNITDISSSFNSIQVQRGVGTSATGTSSYAGSVNFESFNVSDAPAFSQFQLGAGSFGTYRANFSTNSGVSEKGFGFYSSVSKLWSDGYKRNTATDATSLFLTGGYFGDKDLVRLTAFIGRSENGLGYYTIEQSLLDQDPRFNNLTENDRDDFQQYLVQLQYTRKFNAQSSLNTTLYYGGAGGDFREGTPDVDSVFVENYFTNYRTTFFSINYPLKNDHYGLISNYHYNNNKWDVSAGVHGYLFNRENREAIAPDNANPYYDDRTEKKEIALFARAKYLLGRNLELFSDLQFRTMSISFEPDYDFIFGSDLPLIEVIPPDNITYSFLNPRIGFTYKVTDDQNLYASFGRSGREPTRVDLLGGFQLNISSFDLLRDPQFESEYVNNLEVGYRISRQKLFLAANLFYMNFTNEIAPTGEIIAFGVQRRINIPDSYRAGVELEWNTLLTDKLSYAGNFTAMDAGISSITIENELIEDVKPVLTPSFQGTHTVKFNPVPQIGINLSLNHLSESYMEFTNQEEFTVPGYFTLDFGFSWNISKTVNMNFMLNNILDRTYYTYGAPSDVDFSGVTEPGFLPQAPRNFFISTQFRF
ncbi:MAG: TonB-dependent receptor, partial [Cyclobacteriaceae bacterium]